MRKGKLIGKIFGIALVLVMFGSVVGGVANTASATTEKTTISVTDSSPWFTKGSYSGHPEYWYSHTYSGHDYISTYVGGMSGNPSQPDCWAKFKPYLSQSGEYDVYAYFYACEDTSTKVPFTIYYSGSSTTIRVNQYSSSPVWKEVKLGTWNFATGDSTCIMVTDATGETYNGVTGLTIGAVKFVKLASKPGAFTLTGEALCDGDSPYIHLSWTPSSGATSYDVYRNGSFYYDLATLGTTFDNINLPPETTYTYFIRATNAAGSTDSNTVTVTTKVCAEPGAFTLTGEALCDGDSPYNHLSWTSSSGATSYDVYRNGSFYFDLATLGTTFDNTEVTAGTTYTYFIRATNAAGSTDSNTVSVTTCDH